MKIKINFKRISKIARILFTSALITYLILLLLIKEFNEKGTIYYLNLLIFIIISWMILVLTEEKKN